MKQKMVNLEYQDQSRIYEAQIKVKYNIVANHDWSHHFLEFLIHGTQLENKRQTHKL